MFPAHLDYVAEDNSVRVIDFFVDQLDLREPGLAPETIEAFAHRGFSNGEEVTACEGTGNLPCMPKTQTSNNPNRGESSRGRAANYEVVTDGEKVTHPAIKFDEVDDARIRH